MTPTSAATCRHCGRHIVKEDGRWVDPEATGDDSVWRETCDAHDTFTAEHEPTVPGDEPVTALDYIDWTICYDRILERTEAFIAELTEAMQ